MPRSTRRATLATLAALAAATTAVAPARAEAPTSTMDVQASLAKDGSLTVTQNLTFDSASPTALTQTLATSVAGPARQRLRYTVSDVKATIDGKPVAATVAAGDKATTITLDTSRTGQRPISISYRVVGAVSATPASANSPAGVQLRWPLLQGLSVPVRQVTGMLETPGQLTFVDCESGTPGTLRPCTTFAGGTHESPQPSFSDGPRAAGEVVELTVGLPEGAVAPNADVTTTWSLDRAFTVNGSTLAASLLPLLLGGLALFWVHRRRGRDQVEAGRITPVAEFAPVGAGQSHFRVLDEVRPGHVGTVADERVDPIDVTATILDLAVRGWLRIVELPRERAHQSIDWVFERRENGQGELRPFEAELRDAIAPSTGRSEPLRVSELPTAVAPAVNAIQEHLYDDVVTRGWFDRRPDSTRNVWTLLGRIGLGLAVVLTVVLVAFTSYGLVGIALGLLALGALLIGQEMPRRTSAGTALLGGLSALASNLATQPVDQLPEGREYEEIARILPYAVVLGGRERWVSALVAADDDPGVADPTDLDWYHAPDDWHLSDLPDSLTAFIVTVQGQLYGR